MPSFLAPLAPAHTGITSKKQPTLYFYVSSPWPGAITLIINSETKIEPVLEIKVKGPSKEGILSVDLKKQGVFLNHGVEYEWFAVITPDEKERSADFFGSAVIRYERPSKEFLKKIKDASNQRRVFLYAGAGYFYDAIKTVSRLIDSHPETPLLTVVDPDGEPLTYTLVGGADQGQFTTDANGLSFVSAPIYNRLGDANSDNVYEVSVSATDGLFTADQDIKISVSQTNSAPSITSSSAVSAPENSLLAGNVKAVDADAGILFYSIVGGADQSVFSINELSGALTFKSSPDYENPTDANSNNIYEVDVGVNDKKTTTTLSMNVTVTDLNETPAILSPAVASVVENSTSGPTVTSSDPEGDGVTYSISGGADNDAFAIDPVSGALTFLAAPDYENPADADLNNQYEVQIAASDGFGASTQALTITVTSVNEFAPVITSSNAPFVFKNSAFVTTVTSEDADDDAIVHSVAGGADQDKFSVDPSSGRLTFLSIPDFERPTDANFYNLYEVQITASDGLFSATQQISAQVSNVTKPSPATAPPLIQTSSTPNRMPLSIEPGDAMDGVDGPHFQDQAPVSVFQKSLLIEAKTAGVSAIANHLALDLIPQGGTSVGQIQNDSGFLGQSQGPENGSAVQESLSGTVDGFNADEFNLDELAESEVGP